MTQEKTTEFNLSEKRFESYTGDEIEGSKEWYWAIYEEDVKEFIRLLKEKQVWKRTLLKREIGKGENGIDIEEWQLKNYIDVDDLDKLAGEKLI